MRLYRACVCVCVDAPEPGTGNYAKNETESSCPRWWYVPQSSAFFLSSWLSAKAQTSKTSVFVPAERSEQFQATLRNCAPKLGVLTWNKHKYINKYKRQTFMEFHGYILSRMFHRWFEPRIVSLLWTIWAWGRHGDKCWTLAAWNAMLRFGSVGHGPNMASYHRKHIKRTSKNQGLERAAWLGDVGAWTACRTARSGEGFEVDVVFDSACLLFHLIHKELSGSIGIMASKSASSSLLHQLETPPQAPQIARTNQRLWWFVVVNHAKLEVPTLTHTHAPTRFSQFPFLKVVPFNIFQPIFSHLSAIHFFLEANQRNGPSPVCFTVRQSSFRGAGAMLGPGPDWTLAPSWAGLGAATSQKFELHGRVSNFWIPPLDSFDISRPTCCLLKKPLKNLIFWLWNPEVWAPP